MADDAPAWDDIPDWDSLPEPQPQQAAVAAAPAWDDIPDWDSLPGGEQEAEGRLAGDTRELAHSIVPAATGVVGAGAATTLAAPVIGAATAINPLLGAATALGFGAAGMLGGAYVGEKAQDVVLKKGFGYDDDVLRAANRKARPIETQVAGLLPFAGNPAATLGQRAAGAGMMGAFSGGQQLARGEFDPTAIAVDTAFGALMPNGNRLTKALHGVGEVGGNKVMDYIPGRPDTQPRPGADLEKADADTSQSPSVAGNNALAQQPAADPKAPVGQENSKAQGPEDYGKKKYTPDEVFSRTKPGGFSAGDKSTDPTLKAALAPETPPGGGQVIDTGIVEAAQRPPDPLAARYTELKAQYDQLNPRSPEARAIGVEINQIARAARQRDAAREPVQPPVEQPKAALAPEAPKIVGSPDGTGEVPLAPRVTNTMPEAKRHTASSVQRETGLGYNKAADEADRRNGVTPPTVESVRAAEAPKMALAPEVPIEAKVKDGLARQTAKAQTDMIAKLKEKGFNEAAARYEALPEKGRQAIHEHMRDLLRSREDKAVRNKLGKEVSSGTAEERDRHNSAIDAVAKAYESHPPKPNETGPELVARLRAAVDTAHTAHGSEPLRRGTGYKPASLPPDFAWYKHVRDSAARKPEYWTQVKIDKFKAEEDLIRSGNTEKNPDALDTAISLNGREGGAAAERAAEHQSYNPEDDIIAAIDKRGKERKPFDIETEEQELSAPPKRIPVRNRAELRAVEDPTTSLIAPLAEKAKPAAKEKKPKYDFEPKVKSGKELDPETAARYIKMAEEAQAKSQARAAPKPTYEEGDKYSPLKVNPKDLLGNIVSDERGGLDLDKVGAAFKGLFDKFAKTKDPIDKDWQFKIQPSYIAKRVTSEAQQAARNIGELLNRTSKIDNVIKVHALAGKNQAHILADTPEKQRAMYDALEKQDPSLITDRELRDVFEHSIVPVHIENAVLYRNMKHDHPEVDLGRLTEDGVLRRALNGGDKELELESVGDNTDPTAGSSPISTNRRTPVMERQLVALEDADGNRYVVHLKTNHFGKPTGEYTVWDNYKNHEVDAPPIDPKFQVNDIYEVGGRRFKLKDATVDEIEANVLGNDEKPMKYQRDAAASVFTQNAYLRQLQNHLNALDEIKNSAEFAKYATKSNNEIANRPEAKGWERSKTPGFEEYWMDPHMRETLEDAYQQGFEDSALNKVRNFSRAMTQSIFWTPVAHIMNVEVHWAVGRGWKWLPNDIKGGRNYRDLVDTGTQAIKSVITHDKIQDVLHENGAGLIYGGTRAENATARLALGVGQAIEREPSKWGPIADKLNMTVGELVRGVYKASRHGMWSVNDMFLTQAILERLRDTGKTIDTASKGEIREAIAHIEKHIPNYRTPSRIMSEDVGGRAIAKAMRDPLVFGFGRYRYAVFNSFANMTNSVLHGSKADRIETAGQMMVMAAIAFGVYPIIYKPIAQLITGNDKAEVRGRGPIGPVSHIQHDVFGRGDLTPLVKETVSLSPLVSSAIEAWGGKNFAGKDIVDKKDFNDTLRGSPKAAYNVAKQAGGWALGQRYSPFGTLNSSLNNPNQGVAGGLRDAVLDLKNPSPKAQKYEAQTPRRLQQEHNRRAKAPPSVLEKLLP